jgi:predicted HTH domain antitoxin
MEALTRNRENRRRNGGSTYGPDTIDVPEDALAALRAEPKDFARQLRLAAAVQWYEVRRISQGRAAQIARLSRAEFLVALGQSGVSPFQYGAAEALEEAGRA